MPTKTNKPENQQHRHPKETADSSSLPLLGMTKPLDRIATTGNSELIEIQAVASPSRKRRGEAAEAAFLARAASLGFRVSKPWGESERYDLVIDSAHGFWRIQVKSTQLYIEHRYRVKAVGCTAAYTRNQIDFIAAYVVPENLWYIVPIQAVGSRKGLRFYPYSRPNSKSLLEKYREAWCLLDCPPKARGWNDIPIRCRCPELSVRCAVCPQGK